MRASTDWLGVGLAALGMGLDLALGPEAVPAQEPVKVRIGNLGFPSNSAMIIGRRQLRHEDLRPRDRHSALCAHGVGPVQPGPELMPYAWANDLELYCEIRG